jgi:hypothetical protein
VVGLTLSQLDVGQPVTEAVNVTGGADPTGAGAFTATLRSNGLVLRSPALKATVAGQFDDAVAGQTVTLAGLTLKVSGTVRLLEACGDAMVRLQL